MKKLTIISFIFLLISCGPLAFTTAEYGLKDRSTDKIELPRGKYLFLINNDPTSDTEFSQKITGDFRGILGTNLSNVFKNDYFDNHKFLNKPQIDSALLNNIHRDTGMDFLILLRFGTLEKNIEHNKIIKIEEAKNIMRELWALK